MYRTSPTTAWQDVGLPSVLGIARERADCPPLSGIVILSARSGDPRSVRMYARRFTLQNYRTADGDQPVRRWIGHDLSAAHRKAVMAALKYLLAAEGIGICASEYGRHLGHPPRTRKERRLPLTRSPHTYEKPGKYRTLAKAIDIAGSDTSQAFDVGAP